MLLYMWVIGMLNRKACTDLCSGSTASDSDVLNVNMHKVSYILIIDMIRMVYVAPLRDHFPSRIK